MFVPPNLWSSAEDARTRRVTSAGWKPARSLLENCEDVVLTDDQALLAIELDLGAAVLPEEDAVADLHVELLDRAVLEDLAVANSDDLTLDRLLFGRIGDDDPTLGLLLFLHSLEDHAVLQGTDIHSLLPRFS